MLYVSRIIWAYKSLIGNHGKYLNHALKIYSSLSYYGQQLAKFLFGEG